MYRRTLLHALADALLAGPWNAIEMRIRLRATLGARAPWVARLVSRLRTAHATGAPSRRLIVAFIAASTPVSRSLGGARGWPRIRRWLTPFETMGPRRPWATRVPQLENVADVARWLGVTDAQLARLAERDGVEIRPAARAHRNYTYRWVAKPSGGARLLEAPRARLRQLQRVILHGMLDRVPAHAAAHGFRRDHSALSHARNHVGRDAVLRIDLTDFFGSVPRRRVHGIFAALGYPETVSRMLASLCTHATPPDALRAAPSPIDAAAARARFAQRQRLLDPHLPQGAPTSPALANLAAYRLDVRLDAFARHASVTYSRYADDLVFSGNAAFARSLTRFCRVVFAIISAEGFRVNARKTRRMQKFARQSVGGIVVNDRVNVRRDDYERLKATLCNCLRHGPHSQNHDGHGDFRAHLAGRIAWVAALNPVRGRKLAAWFARISWTPD